MYVPVLDPDVHTNGTKRVPVLRFDVLKDASFFKKHSIKSDPFNENADMLDDDSMEIFQQMFYQACEGNFATFISHPSFYQFYRAVFSNLPISKFVQKTFTVRLPSNKGSERNSTITDFTSVSKLISNFQVSY